MFCYENNLVYSVYVSNEDFENCVNLLMITDENKSHYVYIKGFNRFMCNKTKSFSGARVLVEHKETCLKIKTVKLISGSIKFRNYFKQLAVSFKIYSDLESLLKGVRGNNKKK